MLPEENDMMDVPETGKMEDACAQTVAIILVVLTKMGKITVEEGMKLSDAAEGLYTALRLGMSPEDALMKFFYRPTDEADNG